MRFLLNMNIPRSIRALFEAQGHTVRHAGDVGLATASDSAIMEAARRHSEVIVTHDLDYGHLLAFSGANAPSVIILRTPHGRLADLVGALLAAWKEVEGPLRKGAIVVASAGTLRIRPLPIEADGR